MQKENIKDYEPPVYLHVLKRGLFISSILVLGAIIGLYIGISLWIIFLMITVPFVYSIYSVTKARDRHDKYYDDYISTLDSLTVSQIECKLKEMDLGSSTERLLNSYLRKKRGWVPPSCQ